MRARVPGDSDCASGLACVENRCTAGVQDAGAVVPCSYNSQCESPLICRAGERAYECLGDPDCPDSLVCEAHRCMAAPLDGGPDASPKPCSYNSECPQPLVCRAGVRAYECLADGDCGSGFACIDHWCETAIADASVEAQPDAPSTWGNACAYNSQCTAPLVCRSGTCAYQCLGDVDCHTDAECVDYRCQPRATAPGRARPPHQTTIPWVA